jgi:hypothetical protein
MWDRLLGIVGTVLSPTRGNIGDVFRGVCTQSLVLNELPGVISL